MTENPDFDPVPMTLPALLDPAWLAHALTDVDEGDRVVAVEQVGASRTLAQKIRFTVTVEDRAGRRRTTPYCVKAHFDEDGPGTLAPTRTGASGWSDADGDGLAHDRRTASHLPSLAARPDAGMSRDASAARRFERTPALHGLGFKPVGT